MERPEIQNPDEADEARSDTDPTNASVVVQIIPAEKDQTEEESPRFRLNPFWHTNIERSSNYNELPRISERAANGPQFEIRIPDADLPVDTPGFREVSFR